MDTHELDIYMSTFLDNIGNLTWYLDYILSGIYSLPLKKQVRERLVLAPSFVDAFSEMNLNDESLIRELETYFANNNEFFMKYVDQVVMMKDIDAEKTKRSWISNTNKMSHCFSRINPFWNYTELNAMLVHLVDLLDTITRGLKRNNVFVYTNTVPVCQRLIKDISNYIGHGVIIESQF